MAQPSSVDFDAPRWGTQRVAKGEDEELEQRLVPYSNRVYMWVFPKITKSSISIGFSIVNHPFWGTPIFGNTHINMGGFPKMVGFPQQTHGIYPTKNDQHLGV